MNVKPPIIILTVLLLTAAALILYFSLAKRNIRSVGEYTASIEGLILSGDYSKAVTDSADGLRHYPESAELYILKARAYLLSGDTAKALGTLDYGYKQTQSAAISEQREQLTEAFTGDAEFLPLTKPENTSDPDPSASSVTGTGETEAPGTAETYRPDTPIKVTIPNVSPPPPAPQENTGVSAPETESEPGES